MIFVTVGTNEASFDRLLEAVARIDLDEPRIVQVGHSTYRPANAHCVGFLSIEEMQSHISAARAIVTHAGVGTILLSLSAGRRPIVVPRLRQHGEAVDDHQVMLGRRLANAGLVRLVEDIDDLARAVTAGSDHLTVHLGSGPLVTEVGCFIDEVCCIS